MQNDMDPDPLYVHYSNARSVQCIVQVVMRIEHWHAKLFVALQKILFVFLVALKPPPIQMGWKSKYTKTSSFINARAQDFLCR